ncbi:MAG: hypothetical protein JRI45_06585 [Deltaproteobacteria bacterium]|nr:hypothetical protein [Deltaproteobacteria bacterium]
MENTVNLIVAGIIFLYHVWQQEKWDREREKFYDRFMAKSLSEFKYFREEYPKTVKHTDRYNKDLQKIRLKEVEEVLRDKNEVEDTISRWEEDWGADEIDIKRMQRMNDEEMAERASEK